MLATWLTSRFGLTVPVVSAPMAGAAGGHLAAAVSAAGGLGMIGVGDATPPDWLREQAAVAAAGGAAGDGAAGDTAADGAAGETAASALSSGGTRSGGAAYGIGLLGWCRPDLNGQLAAVLGLAAPPVLVSVSYGDPAGDERRLLPALHDAGITVATQVGSREEARRAAAAGFDLLVARGSEGGGHGRDAVATLPLLQEVLDDEVCGQLPVLAAGGIGSARGLAAVLAAGAAGAWVGTAFLATRESLLPPAAIARLLAAASTDTVYTRAYDRGYSLGWPHEFGGRALRNAFTDTWTGRESELPAAEQARGELVAARAAQDYDRAGVYAGQTVGLLHEQRPAADVLAALARAEHLLGRWAAPAG